MNLINVGLVIALLAVINALPSPHTPAKPLPALPAQDNTKQPPNASNSKTSSAQVKPTHAPMDLTKPGKVKPVPAKPAGPNPDNQVEAPIKQRPNESASSSWKKVLEDQPKPANAPSPPTEAPSSKQEPERAQGGTQEGGGETGQKAHQEPGTTLDSAKKVRFQETTSPAMTPERPDCYFRELVKHDSYTLTINLSESGSCSTLEKSITKKCKGNIYSWAAEESAQAKGGRKKAAEAKKKRKAQSTKRCKVTFQTVHTAKIDSKQPNGKEACQSHVIQEAILAGGSEGNVPCRKDEKNMNLPGETGQNASKDTGKDVVDKSGEGPADELPSDAMGASPPPEGSIMKVRKSGLKEEDYPPMSPTSLDNWATQHVKKEARKQRALMRYQV